MLKKLASIATAVVMALAIVFVAALIEAPSARAQAPPLTTADLQSDRAAVLVTTDGETRTMVVETVGAPISPTGCSLFTERTAVEIKPVQ